ncbi:MAG: sigma 54-interacting transcriptional regulator [Thermoflexales bacterium]|nr:sigma 54-interacting transcriptional regulator [Thermoflexales bacterium]
MLPTAYPYDMRELTSLWEKFVQEGTLSLSSIDPAVARSWLRCRNAGMDPQAIPRLVRCTSEELEHQRQEHFDLIAIARPLMEDIYQFAGESGIVVYLTNQHLLVMESLGDRWLRDALYGCGFTESITMAEEYLGTNAASLALYEGTPVQVVGPEHFFKSLHRFSGSAAPLHDPCGRIIGVIGIITPVEHSHPHTLGLVMATARAIENQLQADASLVQAHRHLAELKTSLQAMQKGIVFLDAQGVVTHMNDSAGEILGISPKTAPGRPLHSLVRLPSDIQTCLSSNTPMSEREVAFGDSPSPRLVMASLDVMKEGTRPNGFVITLRPVKEARQIARYMMGMQAVVTFDDILGWSTRMRRVIHYARAIARCNAPVLLLGEPGTGKDLFAQAIHNASHYADGPFVSVNCAAAPREMIAYELLGYENGMGPSQGSRPSKFEIASGGTIFLQNIESLPLNLQAALLEIIDTRQVVRIGGTSFVPVDVRVIAASSVNLEEEMRQKRFRADLFYRLRSLTLTIPPLRERGDDIILLATHIVNKCAARFGKEVTISPEAMAVLKSYSWPGNLRELENVLEWAVHLLEGTELNVRHLPEELRRAVSGGEKGKILTFEEAERQAIIMAGQAFRGNVTQMANALGVGRTTLWRKMRSFGIHPADFRQKPRSRPYPSVSL